MKLNPHFCELYSLYQAEIEDLTFDSDGANVLKTRLAQKRQQLLALMPMAESNPEMVAPTFHGAIQFKKSQPWEKVCASNPDMLPTWESLKESVTLQPWVTQVLPAVLEADGGEKFWTIACALEYLDQHHANVHAPVEEEYEEDESQESQESDGSHLSDEYDRNDDEANFEDKDLGEAGDKWLQEQGFESRKK